MKLKIWRPDRRQFATKTVRLGKWPVRNDKEVIATAQKHPDWRGLRIDHATARARYFCDG